MTRYLLECPECESRFELKAYVPEKRVRCRKCRAILSVPFAPDDPAAAAAGGKAPELPPELRRKVSGALSLRRLAVLAAVLLAAVVGGLVLLVQRREARLEAVSRPPEIPALTLENLAELLPTSALPLGRGFLWEYALAGGGTEIREVLRAVPGPEGEPEFEVQVRGSSQSGLRTYRVTRERVILAADVAAGARVEFEPPLAAMPNPLFADADWMQEGQGKGDDGAVVRWSIRFRAEGTEKVETPAGVFPHAVRIAVSGVRAGRAVEETLWVQRGTGVVKRRSSIDGRTEEALLKRFAKR